MEGCTSSPRYSWADIAGDLSMDVITLLPQTRPQWICMTPSFAL